MVLLRSQCYTSVDVFAAAEQQYRIACGNPASEFLSQVEYPHASAACLQHSAKFLAV